MKKIIKDPWLCPNCDKKLPWEAQHYYGLGDLEFATCPNCKTELVSDFEYRGGHGLFYWRKQKYPKGMKV